MTEWNLQTRGQLVEDLYYTCRQDGEILEELLDELVGPSSIILLHDLMYGNTDPFYHVDLSHHEGQWASGGPYRAVAELNPQFWEWSTLPWNNGLTILRKKYSNKYHRR